MKALILNSGLGSRMKNLNTCKCLVELADDVTIFDAQITSMLKCGIDEFIITTGPYADIFESYARERYPGVNFTFVNNPQYSQTNYIYSIYLARDLLSDDDILLMHGDLVFEQNVLQDIIAAQGSVMVIDSTQPLPEKDFKAVIVNGFIKSVSIDTFDFEGGKCCYAQPLYKLLREDWTIWLNEISNFCNRDETQVYAENALNNVSHLMQLYPLDITGRKCFEVDNRDDLAYAQNTYKNMPDRIQTVYAGYGSLQNAHAILTEVKAKKPFIVCGLDNALVRQVLGCEAVYFKNFTPNPDYFEVMDGISLFNKEKCDFIISIGGGSAIDVAKCINGLDVSDTISLLEKPKVCHLAIPTTAGTGSESTCFAVLYKDNEKLSIEHRELIPDFVILDPTFLQTLPLYHKKASLLDAYAQAVESLWAEGKTPASKSYALGALRSFPRDIDGYMRNDPGNGLRILQAANLAGKAINISKTTAAHAMSYKLSSIANIAHGHAVALCLPYVWNHFLDCVRAIDESELSSVSCEAFIETFLKLDMPYIDIDNGTINEIINDLVVSVNPLRLKNHPVEIPEDVLKKMYTEILMPQISI